MRILSGHNYYLQPGGEDMVFSEEKTLLRQHGHEIVEYIEDNKRIDEMTRLAAGAQTIWSRPTRRALLCALDNYRPHIAHFHNTFPLISPSAYYACQEADIPVVQTLHNYRILCPTANFLRNSYICENCLNKTLPWPSIWHACYHGSRLQTSVVAAMLLLHNFLRTWKKRVNAYIALTEFSRKKFIQGGLPPERIFVKPNFVYPDPGFRQSNGNYALFIGRLSLDKGVKTLLKAWRNLKNIPLKIVGNGPQMKEMCAFVQANDLRSVKILGRRTFKEVLALMKGAHCLVFPSEWYETFGRVVSEAFACGVPVIASHLGAMEELITDGYTGLHFKLGDPEDLAAKVEWAWTHRQKMQQMGENARLEYEEKYTAGHNYKILMDIYLQAIDIQKR